MFKKMLIPVVVLATALGLMQAPAFAADVQPPSTSPGSGTHAGMLPTTSSKSTDPIRHPVKKTASSTTAKTASSLLITPSYYYATGRKTNTSATFYEADAILTVNNPWVNTAVTDHSIAEIAAIRGTGSSRQIIEIGWGVNIHADGDLSTRFWAGYWLNNTWSGYNPAAFVPYSGGSSCGTLNSVLVPLDSNGDWTGANAGTKHMQIQYTNGNWWLACGGSWVGYFPASIWSSATGGALTAVDRVDFFGEVYSDWANPDSDMGEDGVYPVTATAGAYFSGSRVNETGTTLTLSRTDAAAYNSVMASTSAPYNSFRYGGDGY